MSTQIGPDLPPEDPIIVAAEAPRMAAGCAVFDVWIGNPDRHEENLLYSAQYGLWLIDHEQALAGTESDLEAACERLQSAPLRTHMFRDVTLDPVEVNLWTTRITHNFSMSVVDGILEDARLRGLFTRPTMRAYRHLLATRKARLAELVHKSNLIENDSENGEEEIPWPVDGGS
ncbi:hypothetical protein LQF12_02360 [Ruania suaedae]|uniref:hypothetical protein n=1 Tax=Ruania suaedae TaxID=2897774 RepID=UPI001E31E1BF|nr:hypothetical protein [Ruania suaedae]UFU03476.1 hypothetical protein LQF12_02360 [Ruania suaedae]